MVDPITQGRMLVGGLSAAQPAATQPAAMQTAAMQPAPMQQTASPYGQYPDPFATGILHPAYRNTSGVNVGYDTSGNLIDTITGRRINTFGFNNPYTQFQANVPSWMAGVASSEGMPGAAGVTDEYQAALDKQKRAEFEMLLRRDNPSAMRRSGVAQNYLEAYANLKPLQVQKDVAEGRTTPEQAQAWLMLYGQPNQVGGGFADDPANWQQRLQRDQQHLADYKRQLAEYGTDPRYEVQRRSLTSTIGTLENELLPLWAKNRDEDAAVVARYQAALGGYQPQMEAAPFADMANRMVSGYEQERAADIAKRAELEAANKAAEEASMAYRNATRGGGEVFNEAKNAQLFEANLASRQALSDFIESSRERQLAKGGLAVKAVWDRKRPVDLGEPKTFSAKRKKAAKSRAKAAGRPYPNLVDNMAVARKKGK